MINKINCEKSRWEIIKEYNKHKWYFKLFMFLNNRHSRDLEINNGGTRWR